MQTVKITSVPVNDGLFNVTVARDGEVESIRLIAAETIKHATASLISESLKGGWIWTFTSDPTPTLDTFVMEVVAPGEPRPSDRQRGRKRA